MHYPRGKKLKSQKSRRRKVRIYFFLLFLLCASSFIEKSISLLLNYDLHLVSFSLRKLVRLVERKVEKVNLINFHSRGSYFAYFVASRSERICIESPNPINQSFPVNVISSRTRHFRLMHFISVWRCKYSFSTAMVSIKNRKIVWFDFTESE